MLDNSKAIVLIRGERPIIDDKYDILKHPKHQGKPRTAGARPISTAPPACMRRTTSRFPDVWVFQEYHMFIVDNGRSPE